MLNFELSISKETLANKEPAGFIFKFTNLSDKLITLLWYKFTFYRDGIITDDYPSHEYLVDIEAGEEKEQKFGEVDIPTYYMGCDDQAGNYTVAVKVGYFVRGEKQSRKKTAITKFAITNFEGGLN